MFLKQIEILIFQYYFRDYIKYFLTGKIAREKTDKNIFNIKRELLRGVGQAKQCVLCSKIFSSEYKAINHIHEVHSDFQLEDL